MKVLTFIPLTRQRGLDTLSYFSDQDFPIGSICDIPVRNRVIRAILCESHSPNEAKTSLRNQSFNLKPLTNVNILGQLPPEIVAASNEVAVDYAGTIPVILNSWLTKLDSFNETLTIKPVPEASPLSKLTKFAKQQTKPLHQWQTGHAELLTLVKRLTKNKDKTVAVIVADRNQQQALELIFKDIDHQVIHGKTTPKQLQKKLDCSFIITTGSFGPIASLFFDQVVIINPGGDSWRERRWPFVPWDAATSSVCSQLGRETYMWSTVLDATNWNHYTNGNNKSKHYIVDTYVRSDNPNNPNTTLVTRSSGQKSEIDIVFDRQSQTLIQKSLADNQKTLIYVTRNGLYPVLTCQDCRHTTYTKKFKEQIQRYQIATAINDWVDPNEVEEWVDRCEACGSWRLHPVALSLHQTKDALKQIIPNPESLTIIDSTLQSPAESKKLINNFFKDPESRILLTTQRGAYNLTNQVDNTIIVSLDAALTSNSLSVETDMLRLLWHLEQITTKQLLVQTRLENNRVLDTFLSGAVRKYQTQGLAERQALQFPPFYTHIKINAPIVSNLPHFTELKKLVTHELKGQLSVLPSLENNQVLLIIIDNDTWKSSKSDPLRNYFVNLSTTQKILINPDIIL